MRVNRGAYGSDREGKPGEMTILRSDPHPQPLSTRERAEDGLVPGVLADNLLYFARALRAAGLPVGPGALLDAIEAAASTPMTTRADFHALLHAVFVKKHEHTVVFDGVFEIFWRRRGFLEQLIAAMSPIAPARPEDKAKAAAAAARVADALRQRPKEQPKPDPTIEFDARLTVSSEEVLRAKDFAQMSADEIRRAFAEIARLRLPADRIRLRRLAPDPRGVRIDPRRSFRRSLRGGGAGIDLARRDRVEKAPPIVAICDVSGSMADYTRVFLHFLHALAAQRRVSSFLFGTRLSNVSRALEHRDVDAALASVAAAVPDWSGGTRIASSLHLFNKHWLRRVAGGSATVILFTDGLERDGAADLAPEMRRLQASCRRLIWLNPLLRFDAFQAKASGIRAMLPLVDEFRPIHNLKAVADLCLTLGEAGSREADPRRWLAA